jgi:aspartyl-tRNA(Asn)/glutamyl-tRNA(Gln) amidotransferase subunit A
MHNAKITLAQLSSKLVSGQLTSRQLIEDTLQRIDRHRSGGGVAFLEVDATGARAMADAVDAARLSGHENRPSAGIPISVKDLFDVEGQVTRAGSVVLGDQNPAKKDAVAVAKLRGAGFIPAGRTNMTEFAYSGLGLNPHHGTPLSPFERHSERPRIAGGSSSGAAVSVAEGLVPAGVGTDTGGSCRIPAAFCGIVGYKPTARRIGLQGAFPLSASLDSIGPLTRSVACCATLDAIMSGTTPQAPKPLQIASRRFGILRNYVLEDMDQTVAAAFDRVLRRLADSGAELVDITLPDLDELPGRNARGGIVAAEAYALHAGRIAEHGEAYDPRVRTRILKGQEQQAGEHAELLAWRERVIGQANRRTHGLDAVIMPTVPVVPPHLDVFEDDAVYGQLNLLALRNPTVANLLDRCAISLPLSANDEAPVGLTLMGETLGDRALFDLAAGLEHWLQVTVS